MQGLVVTMAQKGFLSRLRSDTSGNVLAISAAAMIPLTLIVGSALDLGVTYMARGKLQNACDAGVLAARQSMTGTTFDKDAEKEGDRFFAFNFPDGTAGVEKPAFSVTQDSAVPNQVNGKASAKVPTSLVKMIGFNEIEIKVDCEALKENGYNDIMMVLDVTGSMLDAPTNGGGTKIGRLREGALGLYRALQGGKDSFTRFGMIPYSHTVNVGRSLENADILNDAEYVDGSWTYQLCDTNGMTYWGCVSKTSEYKPIKGFGTSGLVDLGGLQKYVYNAVFTPMGTKSVSIGESGFGPPGGGATIAMFRQSGEACIQERSTIDPSNPVDNDTVEIRDYVTQQDIDTRIKKAVDFQLKFGRYDPSVQNGFIQDGCPAEATRLTSYNSESSFSTAVNAATARVTGGTYHDVGMLWGTRFISRNGFFAGNGYTSGQNAKEVNGNPVNMHIVFMTDGVLDTGDLLYSAHGVEKYEHRTTGTGTQDEKHIARFASTCNLAKAMGVTVWVIALDVTDSSEIKGCATSASHFYTSDGSDLEEVFETIGKNIGKLRLTK